jgi:hypothetical protein
MEGVNTKAEALYLANRTCEAFAAIKEAEELVERSGERFCSAELHRLSGVFLTALGAEADIKASFCAAISIANEQNARSLAKTFESNLRKIPQPKRTIDRRQRFPATSLLMQKKSQEIGTWSQRRYPDYTPQSTRRSTRTNPACHHLCRRTEDRHRQTGLLGLCHAPQVSGSRKE